MMSEVSCYTFDGRSERRVSLPAEWFGADVNKHALYQAVQAQRTNDRAGTASTRTRAQVRGGGAKPWRQKGTGRARAGSIRSPLWPGGGTIFGPATKTWRQDVPRQVRRLAFASALSDKVAEEALRVVELEALDSPKTARLSRALRDWELGKGKALLLTAEYDENLYKSGRNIPWLTMKKFRDASALDVLRADWVVVEDGAWSTRGEPER